MAPSICFLQYASGAKVRNAWRVLSLNHFSPAPETTLDHSHFGQLKLLFGRRPGLPDLQKQRDEFALTVSVRLGKDGFRAVSREIFNSRAAISVGAPRAMMQASLASEWVRRGTTTGSSAQAFRLLN
jgi:hypothetical protein